MIDLRFFVFYTALRETGRPVLVAPPAVPSAIGHCVAIAWNGSAEAAHAIAGALSFIEAAERVVILTSESERTKAKVAPELARYLAYHGVAAEAQVFEKSRHPSVGEAIFDHCRNIKADLLVMGAYTHSRTRELLFGGVTQYALDHADIPVLMAH